VLKNRTSIPASLAPLFVALMLMMVSCTKEECIAPAGVETSGTVKGLPTPSHDGGSGPVSEGNGRDDDPPMDGTTEDIGDDGDDISDTERNRKKR
jgi:hypothetical protein